MVLEDRLVSVGVLMTFTVRVLLSALVKVLEKFWILTFWEVMESSLVLTLFSNYKLEK